MFFGIFLSFFFFGDYMETFSDNLVAKSGIISKNKFYCEKCDYKCCKKYNWEKHLLTAKHCQVTDLVAKSGKKLQEDQQKSCENCGKQYISRNGLWKHKLKCVKQEDKSLDTEQNNKNNEISDKELMLTILKENSELKTMILDVCKTMASSNINNSINNSNNNNNNNNKTFNIQVYLNENCKDALNLSEFVSSIQLQLHDLEETGRLGYVNGISQIINTNLHNLDATKRPIQCSDIKRETLYIKEENKWFKEDEKKEKIKNAIKQITRKNIQQIPNWINANPGCMDSESKHNDTYLQILFNAMSGDSTEEQSSNINKIVSKVSKGAAIDK
jgi:hypothetical protein